MSIIIPGVELPPIDEYLHLRIDGNGYVSAQISENQYICDLYDTDKKAIELPPHGDLIDREKIPFVESEYACDDYAFRYDINEMTPVIPAEGGDAQ